MDSANEMLQHHFRGFKVGNHTIPQRTNRGHCTRGTPHHLLGFFANGEGLLRILINRHYRGLLNHYAFTQNVDQNISSAQINPDIPGEATK
jgi:hypothetical protein